MPWLRNVALHSRALLKRNRAVLWSYRELSQEVEFLKAPHKDLLVPTAAGEKLGVRTDGNGENMICVPPVTAVLSLPASRRVHADA